MASNARNTAKSRILCFLQVLKHIFAPFYDLINGSSFMNIITLLKKILFWAYLASIVLLVLIPLLICLINSFRSTPDLLRGFLAIPKEITLESYFAIVVEHNAIQYLLNSLRVTILGVFCSFLVNPFIAFVISIRWENMRYRLLYIILSACMLVPENVLLFPFIKLLYALRAMNITGLLFYYVVDLIPGTVFILVPYFRVFNTELLEAAQLDGCSEMQLFYRIFLPICKPFILTLLILNTVWIWNDFLMPLLILNKSPDTWTIPIFIYNFLGRSSFKKNLAFASCQLALMPISLFYGFFHKTILSGLNQRHFLQEKASTKVIK